MICNASISNSPPFAPVSPFVQLGLAVLAFALSASLWGGLLGLFGQRAAVAMAARSTSPSPVSQVAMAEVRPLARCESVLSQ